MSVYVCVEKPWFPAYAVVAPVVTHCDNLGVRVCVCVCVCVRVVLGVFSHT